MTGDAALEIFLAVAPGLEDTLCDELRARGFAAPKAEPGGVTIQGGWREVWRANLEVRGASRVLVRLGAFRAGHLSQLDKLARRFPWGDVLRADVPLRVEVTTKRSRIYHSGAAQQRIETALREELGARIAPDAAVQIKARFENNLCTLSVDTSGELLHKRGFKEAVSKAPMRETLAALFLRQCGYDGAEPVLDPMCGSGTFVIEAAEIALGLMPGRARGFAFEQLATFDDAAWQAMRDAMRSHETGYTFYGSDRDAGAVRMATANAKRAGVAEVTSFSQQGIEDLTPPDGAKGLIIVNPPYGTRIKDKTGLRKTYAATGETLRARFKGWRVGLITSDADLAMATKLPFAAPGRVIDHGGLKIRLYQTKAL